MKVSLAFRVGFCAAAAAAIVSSSRQADAQVNWDVGVQGGAMKRFTTGADYGVSDPGFGPTAEAQVHLAVIPMLRVGMYVHWDLSPMSGAGTRNFALAGFHAKFTPPLLPTPWKLYLFAGFGGGYTHADGYTTTLGTTPGVQTNQSTVQASSLTGGLLEIPVGVGLSHKLSGPFDVFAELGCRFGVAFFGQMYDSDNTATLSVPPGLPAGSSQDSSNANFTGIDSFALSLSVGVSLDE
jgi:hypothetical protein